ncbi:MAG: hypothetical protein CVU42_06475 [Chloroflexi bacterium HGW-Chloroflexi-4]|jgi:hypothetical protein|nr:MAG: hypothetical protein CVU45_05735 [Chloroflexi bacterium HGW-Chloroflexi-7]PKN99989.1 MAG: hypothetical protein CVU42_06475 [Chloroflexi bacterium HGW-Chloroflexi-4]
MINIFLNLVCIFCPRVLNLTVAMIKILLLKLMLPVLLIFQSVNQITPGLYVLNPSAGQIVTGTVEIKGSVPDDNFEYAEISYSFSDETTSNWFLIERLDQTVHDDTLALWDTTTITDGVFRLKISVFRTNGSVSELIIEDIRVANYTHYDLPTATITPIIVLETPSAGETVEPTVSMKPLPTDLPKNPAAISEDDFKLSMISGVTLTVLVLLVLGIYILFRRIARK